MYVIKIHLSNIRVNKSKDYLRTNLETIQGRKLYEEIRYILGFFSFVRLKQVKTASLGFVLTQLTTWDDWPAVQKFS